MVTIYRKYRSQNFKEIVGQEHVVEILKQAVLSGRLAHAYLFCGPRGTGKTSMARILSKAINCLQPESGEPCNLCKNCAAINSGRFMDLIEIDAASNRGIDEIRSLKETIGFLPVEGKHKVYIIDEVHMLTEQAFNALLKTLEEPPDQVTFILATTEPHKLPLTIISRTQRFDFKLANEGHLNEKLSRILKAELKEMDDEALSIVIKAGQGSYRDAETVLEKVLSSATDKTKLSRKDVERFLGYVDHSIIEKFFNALMVGDSKLALNTLDEVALSGANTQQFLKEILEESRARLALEVKNNGAQLRRILIVVKELSVAAQEMRVSLINALPLEIAIVNLAIGQAVAQKDSVTAQASKIAKPVAYRVQVQDVRSEEKPNVELKKEVAVAVPVADLPVTTIASPEKIQELLAKATENWQDLLQEAKKYNHFLAAILSGSGFSYDSEKGIILKVNSSFHKKQIDSPETRRSLNKIIASICGESFDFSCIIDKNTKQNLGKSPNTKLVEELLLS